MRPYERLTLAEKLYQEYQEAVDAKVLTDQEIAHIGAELASVAELLDQLGTLEFCHKRYLVEKLDITGTYLIEGNTLYLDLAVHAVEFERVPITDLEPSQNHQSP